MSKWTDLLTIDDHRPWPAPEGPWVMTMSWDHLLAAHWSVPVDKLASQIPDGLELDTFEGKAWLSVVPFMMNNVSPRGLTWWPRPYSFPELNLRTYVTVQGDTPGVWFFGLEAASRLAVWGARTFFHLPYFNAAMSLTRDGDEVDFVSRRTHRGAPLVEFDATYGPTGPVENAAPGSFEHWIMERYCLYSAKAPRVFRCHVHHPPWPLRPGTAEIRKNTLFEPLGLDLGEPDAVHFADGIDVVGWGLQQV